MFRGSILAKCFLSRDFIFDKIRIRFFHEVPNEIFGSMTFGRWTRLPIALDMLFQFLLKITRDTCVYLREFILRTYHFFKTWTSGWLIMILDFESRKNIFLLRKITKQNIFSKQKFLKKIPKNILTISPWGRSRVI